MKYCISRLLGLFAVSKVLFLISCRSEAETLSIKDAPAHLIEHFFEKGKSVFIDTISNKCVMKEMDNDTGTTVFYSYRVTITDSTIRDEKQNAKWQKYFRFDFQYDWKAIVDGDSITPVFFQAVVPKKNLYSDDAIIVFELKKGFSADTLTFNNRFDEKGMQVFDLNIKNKR